MNENGGKSSTILLTVIGIATLLVVVTGATFAFFAAQTTGDKNATSVYIKAGTGGSVLITGGEPITLKGIYPKAEAWASQTFTVTYPAAAGAADTVTQTTGVDLVVDQNNFKAGYLKVKMILDSTSTNYTESTNAAKGLMSVPNTGSTHLVTGSRKRNAETKMKYTLEVYFPEIASENQNDGNEHTARFYMRDVSAE